MYYQESSSYRLRNFMYSVYGWMFTGLMATSGIAYYVGTNESLLRALAPYMMWIIIGQFALVMGLAFFVNKMSAPIIALMFLLYSCSVGITVSVIFALYTLASIYATFAITAGMFGSMALYGYVTRADLSSMGSMCIMALFGLIIGSFVNIFLQSPAFDFVLSGVGVVIFTLLTAYDVQKIKHIGMQVEHDESARSRFAVLGALTLYLDFINLFLYLLRFFGRRND